MAEERERPKTETKGKSVSVYSIVSAQAGGVSDAILRATAGDKLESFKPVIGTTLSTVDGFCVEATKKKTTDDLKNFSVAIWNDLVNQGKYLIDLWKAGLGLQMGTAFMGLFETYYGYPQLLSIYQTEKIDAGIRPRLERYWNSLYTPNAPDSLTAFRMHMEGKLSRAEFNQYCSWEGWATEWHDKLYALYDREPDEHMAFLMFKRGLITETAMKQCFRIRGYDTVWDKPLYQALHRRPSFRELTVLADYSPLPELWVTEVLRAQGYLDSDINYILPAIRMRPLREETRSVVGRYLWEYQIGRLDRDTLKTSLKALGLLPKELELNLLWADLRYADELLDEKTDIIEARVSAGDPDLQTQEAIKTELTDLGILEEKANLMAELWYYKYVYTPP